MRTAKLASVAVLLLVTAYAMGQPVIKYRQPWVSPLCNYESRVVSCTQPDPLNMIALDDWVCPQNNKIHRITWWGWIYPGQGQRQFLIAIFNDNGSCQPDLTAGPIFEDCVTPGRVRRVGTACADCPRRPTFRLSARLTTPFNQEQGARYWLQISEDDNASVRPGEEDFRWSGHYPIEGCAAVEAFPVGVLPADPCWNDNVDLAFALWTRTIHGDVGLIGSGLAAARGLELAFLDQQNEVVETLVVDVYPDGHFMAHPSIPPGQYMVVIDIVGAEKLGIIVAVPQEGDVDLEPQEVCLGDINGDGVIDFGDINWFVNCLLGY